jgi:hypothetical protein
MVQTKNDNVVIDDMEWVAEFTGISDAGQLSLHVASIPSQVAGLAALEEFDAAEANFDQPEASSVGGDSRGAECQRNGCG